MSAKAENLELLQQINSYKNSKHKTEYIKEERAKLYFLT